MTARILTVRQPWAWSIIHAGKDVENRSRNIAGDYRGPVLIHAGLTAVDDDDAIWDADRYKLALSSATSKVRHRLDVRGAIVGVVDLVDVHSASVIGGCGRMDNHCAEHPNGCRHHCSPWALGPAPVGWYQHLVFSNPRALDVPLAYRGGLGLRRTRFEVVGDWLAEVVDGCTCHGPTSGPHEPGCGLEAIARLVAPDALPVVIERMSS